MAQPSRQTLYRKYRPQSFGELCGQDHITRTLQAAIQSGRLAHAYLFSGPRGTGKTSAARLLAKILNCRTPATLAGGLTDCCCTCDVCKRVEDLSFMDIIEIDAASNNGVDDIREMREKVKYRPVEGKHKVYIIDEVHMLSGAAFNAFLKTLEEPPPNVVFVLATTDPQKVPATILSRCQCFDFHAIPRRVIVDRLTEVVKRERAAGPDLFPEVPAEVLQVLAECAEGGFRDALSLLDQVTSSHAGGKVELDTVLAITRRLGHQTLKTLASAVFNRDAAGLLQQIDELFARGSDVGSLGKDLLEFLRRAMLFKVDPGVNRVLELSAEQANDLIELVKPLPVEYLLAVTSHLERALTSLRHSIQPRLLLELELIRLAQREVSLGLEGVERRVAQLETAARTPFLQVSGVPMVGYRPGDSSAKGTVAQPAPAGTRGFGSSPAPTGGNITPFPGLPASGQRPIPIAGSGAGRPTGGEIVQLPTNGAGSSAPSRANDDASLRWERFRERLNQANPRIGALFQIAVFDGFKDGVVQIHCNSRFALDRCREPKAFEAAQGLIEELFGKGVKLQIRECESSPPTPDKPRPVGASTPSPASASRLRSPQAAPTPPQRSSRLAVLDNSNPASISELRESVARIDQAAREKLLARSEVQDALQVFGGEVVEIEKGG